MNDTPVLPLCSACGKSLGDKLFARVKQGDQWLSFCSPECLLAHFPRDKNPKFDDASFIETAHAFAQ